MTIAYQCETCGAELNCNTLRSVGYELATWRSVALCQDCYRLGKAEELYLLRDRYVIVHGKSTRWADVLALN